MVFVVVNCVCLLQCQVDFIQVVEQVVFVKFVDFEIDGFVVWSNYLLICQINGELEIGVCCFGFKKFINGSFWQYNW